MLLIIAFIAYASPVARPPKTRTKKRQYRTVRLALAKILRGTG